MEEGTQTLNRKQKTELRRHLSTRQLMGIDQITEHGVKTAKGDLVFYLLQPDNLSVLSTEGVRGRIMALTDLLRSMENVYLLALDSRESFQSNKLHYQQRLETEELPALRELLRQDMAHLDHIQSTTASSREFALVCRMDNRNAGDPGYLKRLETAIHNSGFRVHLAKEQDVKRLLAVFYQQDVTTEYFYDLDGEGSVMPDG